MIEYRRALRAARQPNHAPWYRGHEEAVLEPPRAAGSSRREAITACRA
jgi:hypothetical protein